MVSLKSICLLGMVALGAFTANAQTYWSNSSSINCGNYGSDAAGTPLQVPVTGGGQGYVCFVYGTLPWYAAGAGWSSTVRVSAPPTNPIAIFVDFTDVNAQPQTLDFKYQGDSTLYSDKTASAALYANQPLQINMLGLSSQSGNYTTQAGGPAVVLAYCPDAITCQQVQAQLIYSAVPQVPWSLSAPVVWDSATWSTWSSLGVDDTTTSQSPTDTISFVVYNLANDKAAHTYTLRIYDNTGALYSSGTTKSVAYLGTYADLLKNVVSKIPTGVFKLQLVAPDYAAFEALQFHGASGTTLVSAWENLPSTPAAAAAVNKARRSAPQGYELRVPQKTALQ